MDEGVGFMMAVHQHGHEAMKTTFTLNLECDSGDHAKTLASACFQRIDEIENKLSRYIPGSDIWQLNHMESGSSLFVSDECHQCLLLSMEAYQLTYGYFDVTLGKQIEHRKTSAEGSMPVLGGQLQIVPDRPVVQCLEAGREIDLGGIGKGYALDCLLQLLKDEGSIKAGFLSAGSSTHLAFGEKQWEVALVGDETRRELGLRNEALSASGTAIQGAHIISPFSNQAAALNKRVWVVDPSAAMADARSTAAVLMDVESLREQSSAEKPVYRETVEAGNIEELHR
ncbi:MAG: FAD:protein FMN transferase [Verrucomicrobiota bacterium]